MFKSLKVVEAHFLIKTKKEEKTPPFKHLMNLTQYIQLTKIHLIDSKDDPQTKLFCWIYYQFAH